MPAKIKMTGGASIRCRFCKAALVRDGEAWNCPTEGCGKGSVTSSSPDGNGDVIEAQAQIAAVEAFAEKLAGAALSQAMDDLAEEEEESGD